MQGCIPFTSALSALLTVFWKWQVVWISPGLSLDKLVLLLMSWSAWLTIFANSLSYRTCPSLLVFLLLSMVFRAPKCGIFLYHFADKGVQRV